MRGVLTPRPRNTLDPELLQNLYTWKWKLGFPFLVSCRLQDFLTITSGYSYFWHFARRSAVSRTALGIPSNLATRYKTFSHPLNLAIVKSGSKYPYQKHLHSDDLVQCISVHAQTSSDNGPHETTAIA